MPDREGMISRGECGPILAWLRENVHALGSRYETPELIEKATGSAPSEEPLLDYLEAKFTALYDL